MATDVQICSEALVRLGDSPIASFSENNGPTCEILFPTQKERVLTSHPWRFNTIKSQALTRTVVSPPTQYKYQYQLPVDSLTALARTVWDTPFNAGRGSQFTNFNIFEDKLLTNAEQIFIDYQIDKQPDIFPPHVKELTIMAMMAVLAFPVTDQQNTVDSAILNAWGRPDDLGRGGYSREARRIDSQGHPSQAILNYPLTAVRHGGL